MGDGLDAGMYRCYLFSVRVGSFNLQKFGSFIMPTYKICEDLCLSLKRLIFKYGRKDLEK